MSDFFRTIGPDGSSALTPPLSSYIKHYIMDGNAVDVAWPTGYEFAVLTATAAFYARTGALASAPASVPVANVTDGTGSQLAPGQIRRDGATTFNIIGAAAVVVTIAFFKANQPAE